MARPPKTSSENGLSPGNKLGILRRHLKLTQAQWATRLGVSRGSVSSYEGKSNASPSADVIRQVSMEEGVELSWFYDGEDTLPKLFVRPSIEADEGGTDEYWSGLAKEAEKEGIEAVALIMLRAEKAESAVHARYREVAEKLRIPARMNAFSMFMWRALVVASADLAPRMPVGSVIYFAKESKPPTNSIVLCRLVGTNEFVMLRLDRNDAGVMCLYDFDKKAPPFPVYKGDYDIWGVADTIKRPYVPGQPNEEYNEGNHLPALIE